MNANEVLAELKALGTEQNRKVYQRHGVGENMHGVSFANLGSLKKKIKVDHELAMNLWASGNHEARLLATTIADPAQANAHLLEAWARDLQNYVLTDSFADLVSRTPFARQKAEQWTRSRKEWVGRAGWHLVAHLAMKDETLPDDYFEGCLAVIVQDIHNRKNRVRDAMNTALIAIGVRNGALEKKALSAARKVGVVEVDHGETHCKTPDAAAYILKARRRKK